MKNRGWWLGVVLTGTALCAQAQWLNHPIPGTPRTRDAKPNLTAPAPRVNGKPSIAGIWQIAGSSRKELEPFLLPGGENGLGEDDANKYFLNFFSDFKFGEEPFHPAAREKFRKMLQGGEKPPSLCPPPSVPVNDLLPSPFKIVETPGLVMIMYEAATTFRQIYTDGRKLPKDPQPSWQGYSVGRWESGSFVVDTNGFNDQSVLDAMGHFHSEAMKVTERFRRIDFGHIELQVTVDDPRTYTKAVTIKVPLNLLPDTDLIESFCESENDLAHMPGK